MKRDQTDTASARRGKALIWVIAAVFIVLLWFFLARVALYFDGVWHYVAVPVAAGIGFLAGVVVTVVITPNKWDQNDAFTTRIGTVVFIAAALFAVPATFAPDWWLKSVSGPQQIAQNLGVTEAFNTGRRVETPQSTSSAPASTTRSGSGSSDGAETFEFYQVRRLSTRNYAKSDCQLPYGIEEVVTPIRCDNVEIRDLFIVSQHLCFINDERVTPIIADQYLVLSRYKTTSRSHARDFRDRVKRRPEAFFEGRQPGMIDTFYDALHGKKNEQVNIFETGSDLRTFQRNWDDLKELREALNDVGCLKDTLR